MDSKICYFWFTLVFNHPIMQDCFFFSFFVAYLLTLCDSHGYFAHLHPVPVYVACLMFVSLHVSCMLPPSLFTCSHHCCFLPLAFAITAYFRHCHLFPPLLHVPNCLFPFAFAITAYSHMLLPLPPLQVPHLLLLVLLLACLPCCLHV